MPKHYKEVVEDIINKMNEGFKVKYAMSPNQKIAVASYKSKSDAEKFKNDIIKKGGKAILTTEDAPANSVAGGGVDLAPNAAVSQSPHMIKRKKEQGAEQEKIKNKIKKMVQNNEDNNNIVFKQILDGLDKVDTKVDELNYGKSEVKEVEVKEYKTFKDKYNA